MLKSASCKIWTAVLQICFISSSLSSVENGPDTSAYIFSSNHYPISDEQRPTLANGHLGFTVFDDSVYMNGLYNGHEGLSHRARIPNWANINVGEVIESSTTTQNESINSAVTSQTFSLNAKTGIFQRKITFNDNRYKIIHLIYAHRFYNRAIINQVSIYRLNYEGDVTVQLNRNAGNASEDITFDGHSTRPNIITMSNQSITSTCGYTNEIEDPEYDEGSRRRHHQQQQESRKQRVCVLWNHVPEEITLKRGMQVMSFAFVMTVDGVLSVAKQEMMDVLRNEPEELLLSHKLSWRQIWHNFIITVGGNIELSRAIYASLFYLLCSLPSITTNIESNPFYGLSPTGLPKGGSNLKDYEGHSMWDTEIWMLPTVLLMHPNWSEQILKYRFERLNKAKHYAQVTGYAGARFPWESAFTGREVTQPCCPLVAQKQLHVTADIAFAIRNHFAATNDLAWLQREGCPLVHEIATFWNNRVQFNTSSRLYDIRDVMGPDEDHASISNNVYTNVVAAYALYFADFASCLCNESNSNWSITAAHIKLSSDNQLNYNPQYDGYEWGTIIKQADTVLVSYPLLYPLVDEFKRNNLRFYENVTRADGPAMTWSMHTISHLELNETLQADVLFRKSYQNYIRPPFMVWNEVIKGEMGATNFLTGSGGFLQSIVNGYAGIRMFIGRMEITSPRLPVNTSALSISGIKYMGSKFTVDIHREFVYFVCIRLNMKRPLEMTFENGSSVFLREHQFYNIMGSRVSVQPIDNGFGSCQIPIDTIGMPKEHL